LENRQLFFISVLTKQTAGHGGAGTKALNEEDNPLFKGQLH
jgi:hypothetical protein